MAASSSSKPYRTAVLQAIKEWQPSSVLDLACGDGWLVERLPCGCVADGVDYYNAGPLTYRNFFTADINQGLPAGLGCYDVIVCCEAIAYLENPGQFLRQAVKHLNPGGRLIISSPNPSYAGARLYFSFRGYFPGFSHFLQNNISEAHMPWHAINWPQFWLLLGLAGLTDIRLHIVNEPKPKHFLERIIGFPAKMYCTNRMKKTSNPLESIFWENFGSDQAIYGRSLVVSARCEK